MRRHAPLSVLLAFTFAFCFSSPPARAPEPNRNARRSRPLAAPQPATPAQPALASSPQETKANARPALRLVLHPPLEAKRNRGPAMERAAQKFSARQARPRERAAAAYGKLPLQFEENRGQTDPQVKFLARGIGYTVFLARNEAVLALRYLNAAETAKWRRDLRAHADPRQEEARLKWSQAVLRLKLEGANPSPRIRGLDRQPGVTNYYIGKDPSRWRTGIPSYARVEYRGLYPGVNLVYYGNPGRLEDDFEIEPGASPGAIRMKIAGARRLKINSAGALAMETAAGEVKLGQPAVYQMAKGARREIRGGYRLAAKNEVRFAVGPYDKSRALVIDPTLSYSTYLGGSGGSFSGDQANAIAVDSTGEAYVTGSTTSADFPTQNPRQASLGGPGAQNAFVTKFNSSGTALVFSTYLGGSGFEQGLGIALDSTGDAFVTGQTNSPDFPTLSPLQGSLAGFTNAFISKFSPAGALLFSTYLGGDIVDTGNAIAVDTSGNAYVAGVTSSTNFPTKNPFQPGLAGSQNAFITKIKGDGSALIYSSYLGGSSSDVGHGVAVDSAGEAFIIGDTNSPNFPTLNAIQANLGGPNAPDNAFVTAVNAGGSGFIYSTYFGGSVSDAGLGIAVDPTGANAYITGFTESPDFPLKNSLQAPDPGDVFVAKITTTGPALAFSTLFGGSFSQFGTGIALDSSQNVYVTGLTQSAGFPTRDPLQATLGNSEFGFDESAFVFELKPDGLDFLFSTYLGGSNFTAGSAGIDEQGNGIAVDSSGNIYVAGTTGSLDFPTVNPFQPALKSSFSDGFVAKIAPATPPGPQIFPALLTFGSTTLNTPSASERITLANGTNTLSLSAITLTGANPGDFIEADTCGPTMSPQVVCEITITFQPTGTGARAATLEISDSDTSSPQRVSLAGTGVTPPPPGTVSVSPTTLPFANQEVGTVSAQQFFTVTNTGSVPVTEQGVNITGTDPGDFSASFQFSSLCPSLPTIGVGQQCQVAVTFQPTATGSRSATVQVVGTFTGASPVSVSGTGTAQVASLTPNFLQFPNTVIGQTSAALTATLKNISTSTTLTGITPSIAAPFAETDTCHAATGGPGSLSPGQSCTFSITFTPTTAGFASGSLSVTDSDPISQTVGLFGTGLNPTATLGQVFPTNIPFGRVPVGVTAPISGFFSGNVFLQNTGNTTLTFTTTLSGADASDFATPLINVNGVTACNGNIAAGGSCVLQVTFTPGAVGARFATLTINSAATGAPRSVALSGTGINGTTSSLVPNPLVFPAIAVGQQSAEEFATLSNTGGNLDLINPFTITGTNASDFTLDLGFPTACSQFGFGFSFTASATLNAGATCHIGVFFAPSATGLRTATLQVADTAAGAPQTITLEGGQASAPVASLSPTSLNFGSVTAGTASAPQAVTLSNTGTATLDLSTISFSGTNASDFSETDNCFVTSPPATIQPGQSCTINVTFKPSTAAGESATMNFNDNAAGSPQAVALAGTGTAASAVSLNPTSVNFGAVTVGTFTPDEDFPITLTNSGTAPLTITQIQVAAPFFELDNCVASSPLAPGASCVIDPAFGPAAPGAQNGTLSITDDASGSPQTVPLTGTGVAASVTFSPSSLLFGPLSVGSTSAAQTVTVTNTSGGTLAISSLAATGDFAETNTCGTSLGASQTCSVSVTFTPTVAGPRTGEIVLTSNSPTSPDLVFLTGNSALENLPGFTAEVLPPNDDNSSEAAIPFGFPINFFGANFSRAFVNNNGNITFNAPLSTFTPFGLVGTSAEIIAPYFADVDTRGLGSGVVKFGNDTVNGHQAFGVDFVNVGYFGEETDKLNTFQVVLINRSDVAAGDFDIEFNYDKIQWETGDASGGTDGLGGFSAVVGYSNGSGQPDTSFQLPGSAVNGALLDSNTATGLIHNSLNSSTTGRYVFQVRNGQVLSADLGVAMQHAPDPAVQGQAETFTLTVTNSGPNDATGVVVTDTLPTNATLISAEGSQGTCSGTAPLVCALGTVTNGSSATVQISVTPTSAASLVNSASVSSDLPDPNPANNSASQTVTVTSVNAPTVTASPSSLTFAGQNVGTTSAPQSVTVTNTGTANLTVTSVAASAQFAETDNCVSSSPIAPSGSCTISVTFTPAAEGNQTGALTLTDNAANSPQSVPLSGTGLGAIASISPASLIFSGTAPGTTSAPLAVTVTNTGNANLLFSNISVSTTNSDSAVFAETNNCITSEVIAPSASCTINVTFTPPSPSSFTGALTLSDNAPGSPQTVPLSGSGASFVFTIPPSAGTTATVHPGDTAVFPLQLVSNGFSGTVQLACVNPQATITCSVQPSSVTLAGTGTTSSVIAVRTFCSFLVPPNRMPRGPRGPALWLLALASLAAILLVFYASPARRRVRRAFLTAALAGAALAAAGCGGDPGPAGATPPGTYTLTITATGGGQIQSINLTLIVQ